MIISEYLKDKKIKNHFVYIFDLERAYSGISSGSKDHLIIELNQYSDADSALLCSDDANSHIIFQKYKEFMVEEYLKSFPKVTYRFEKMCDISSEDFICTTFGVFINENSGKLYFFDIPLTEKDPETGKNIKNDFCKTFDKMYINSIRYLAVNGYLKFPDSEMKHAMDYFRSDVIQNPVYYRP